MYIKKQLDDHTWLIGEAIREDFTNTMFLVCGQEKAALIDTGCGIGNLKEYIKEITTLPIIVLTTHIHLDHIGGHSLFEDIYASENEAEEWKITGGVRRGLADRLQFLEAAVEGNEEKLAQIKKQMVQECDFTYHRLQNEMQFHLGKISLRTFMVPGHTKESYVFVEEATGNAFVGDSINRSPWILGEGGTTVEEYGESVEAFAKAFPGLQHVYSGHCMEDIGTSVITDTLQCVAEIKNGCKEQKVQCYAGEASRHVCNTVSMLYRANHIWKDR